MDITNSRIQYIPYGYYGETKEIINMKNYKKILIVLLGTCLLLGTGCIGVDVNVYAEKNCKEVITSLSKDDAEGIKETFCIESQGNEELEDQIEEGIDFFDGRVVSYNDYIFMSQEGESYGEGELVEQDYTATCSEIKTSTGKTYSITIYAYSIDDECPDNVGISEIDIYDEDGNVCIIGECIE